MAASLRVESIAIGPPAPATALMLVTVLAEFAVRSLLHCFRLPPAFLDQNVFAGPNAMPGKKSPPAASVATKCATKLVPSDVVRTATTEPLREPRITCVLVPEPYTSIVSPQRCAFVPPLGSPAYTRSG